MRGVRGGVRGGREAWRAGGRYSINGRVNGVRQRDKDDQGTGDKGIWRLEVSQ